MSSAARTWSRAPVHSRLRVGVQPCACKARRPVLPVRVRAVRCFLGFVGVGRPRARASGRGDARAGLDLSGARSNAPVVGRSPRRGWPLRPLQNDAAAGARPRRRPSRYVAAARPAAHRATARPPRRALCAPGSDASKTRHADALAAAAAILAAPEPDGAVGRHVRAAVAAVESLESNPLYNAGTGAVLTESGRVENEACVMDGVALRAGSVAGLTTVVHPVRLALLVRLRARYQFLGFAAAEAFADRFPGEIARQPNAAFATDRRREDLRRRLAGAAADPIEAPGGFAAAGETVGAVVCDGGRLACATSTGGVSGKMDGRIGDTPVVGAGSYADARLALSGTGVGEEFLRWNAAGRVAAMVEYGGCGAARAMEVVVRGCFPSGTGGFACVDEGGGVSFECNAEYFARASVTSADDAPATAALWWPQ
jgi:L-asparaginase / beta-aspartyl-peptidase